MSTCFVKENPADTIKHGNRHSGDKAAFSTMSNEDAEQVRLYSVNGKSSREIGKIFNVSHTTIQKIIRRERYVK